MKIGLAQLAPIILNKSATEEKMLSFCQQASKDSCDLIVFSEGLLPGYPFWTEHTNGAVFNSQIQKNFFRMYWEAAVDIEAGDLNSFQDFARSHKLAMYLGIIEKSRDRGHSLYCSLVYINKQGEIDSVHRKLRPTYEERLFWSPGDGNGLQVHDLNDFRVGGLNCWENWMPTARAALYGKGENIHVSVWPGNVRNTEPMIRFLSMEGRSFNVAVCGLMRPEDWPNDFPEYEHLVNAGVLADGGSCVANPDGSWLLEPQKGTEDLFIVEVELSKILEERHNFDAAGHYSRPDVLHLQVNESRQKTVN